MHEMSIMFKNMATAQRTPLISCGEDTGESDLTHCPICFEEYRSPKLLHCGHSFCEECLKPLAKSQCVKLKRNAGIFCFSNMIRSSLSYSIYVLYLTRLTPRFDTNAGTNDFLNLR